MTDDLLAPKSLAELIYDCEPKPNHPFEPFQICGDTGDLKEALWALTIEEIRREVLNLDQSRPVPVPALRVIVYHLVERKKQPYKGHRDRRIFEAIERLVQKGESRTSAREAIAEAFGLEIEAVRKADKRAEKVRLDDIAEQEARLRGGCD